ncbi:hypothetical protein D3C73_17350 [compost metagenome]
MSDTSKSWGGESSVLRISDPAARAVVARLLDKLGVHKHTKKLTVRHAVARITLISNQTTERDRVLREVAKHMQRITGVPHKEMRIRPQGGTDVTITYQARI